MSEKEKICPFCGGKAEFGIAGFGPVGVRIRGGMVACQDCGALGPLENSKTAAIKAWNKRTANTE